MSNFESLADEIYSLLSPPVTPESLSVAYSRGLLKKEDLEDGAKYQGSCRNSSVATWVKSKNCFEYDRYKFGSSFVEDIPHPEDDDGHDIFVAVKKLV